MNFFAYTTAAERYARSRPYFHPLVIEKIWAFLKLEGKAVQAVDVACGTGQSARALEARAQTVIGVDPSLEMLTAADRTASTHYTAGAAENLPFKAGSFDLMTVSLAFHWFDRERFCSEAHRLLKGGGWLCIYNNAFYGDMRENPAFAHWSRGSYLVRYPTPPRSSQPFTNDDAARTGFRFVLRENYENDIEFTPETLAAYLTTQSNVIASVEGGRERLEDVYTWLLTEIQPLFPQPQAVFRFGGYIWILQKE